MTALNAPRQVVRLAQNGCDVYGVAAGAVCLAGGIAILAAGYARPAREGQGGNDTVKAADAATYVAVGVFAQTVTGGVADGAVTVKVQPGAYNFRNSAGADQISIADIGKTVFLVDDQTVARTSAGGIRAVAGTVVRIDEEGIWVDVGPAAKGGRRTMVLQFAINETDTLAPTNAELVSPVAGEIIRLTTIVQKAVTTGGDVTLIKGAATAVVGLACTIADGAAKGTVVTDTPTFGDASTKVAVGDRIQVAPAAAFNTAGAVSGFVEIAY